MKVSPLQFDIKSLITSPADRGGNPRSAGLHLSQIYGDLTKAQREREMASRGGEMTEEELEFYRRGGFIWEIIWSQAMAEGIRTGDIVRPGEFMVEGIIGSPDNIYIPKWRVVETKCTWKSVRKWDKGPVEKWFWVWLVQMKGYCRMVGTREVEFYGLFVNGEYRGGGPEVRAVLFEFTQLEIDENWQMIVAHARRRGWIK